MPINPNQNLNPNDPCYSLPVDTMYVGQGGPTPQQVATISKPGKKPSGPPSPMRLKGGSVRQGRSTGKSPAQSTDVRGAHNTGYDGP